MQNIQNFFNFSVFLGVHGASCLERAICEVAATPDHDDGILGITRQFNNGQNYKNRTLNKFSKLVKITIIITIQKCLECLQ